MKRYKKFNRWLADVEKGLNHPARTVNESPLRALGYQFDAVAEQLLQNVESLDKLIAALKKLREFRGTGRGVFEEQVMQSLAYLTNHACVELNKPDFARRPLPTDPDTLPPLHRPPFAFLQSLCRYALDCLAFSRSRDSLAGSRRDLALEILATATEKIELPESVLNTAQGMVKACRGRNLRGALLYCEAYYLAKSDGIPADMETILLQFAAETGSRGLAVAALDILVESGNISEFEALDRIDEWKDRNYYN